MKKVLSISIIFLLLLTVSCKRSPDKKIKNKVSSDYDSSIEEVDDVIIKESNGIVQTNSENSDYAFSQDAKQNDYYIPNQTSDTYVAEKVYDSEEIAKESYSEPNPSVRVPEQKFSQQEALYSNENDADIIADKIIEYINEYRMQNGNCSAVKLSGLTEFAKFRSSQIVTNFAHDSVDQRIAATAVKYGEYIDTKLYGMDGEPYYVPHIREAIAMSGYRGTDESVAKNIATLTKNSPSHWKYVGDAKYSFIGVGMTYFNEMWYVNIAMSDTAQYDK